MKRTTFSNPVSTHRIKKKISSTIDISAPFNYNFFWSYITEDYFEEVSSKQISEKEQIWFRLSKNEFTNQSKKYVPETTKATFLTFEQFLQHNNNLPKYLPYLKKKYIQPPLFPDISKEINYIDSLLLDIEQVNSKVTVFEKPNEAKQFIDETKSELLECVELRLQNLSLQIYEMQMRQFADSIKKIYLYKGVDESATHYPYIVNFDQNDETITTSLNLQDYKSLLNYRDLKEAQAYIDSLQGNESNQKAKDIKQVSKRKPTSFIIGHYQIPKYKFCHHCKWMKPEEDLIQCQNILQKEILNQKINVNKKKEIATEATPQNEILINNSTILLKNNKIYLLQNYVGNNLPEMNTEFFNKDFRVYKNQPLNRCKKFYCEYCLNNTYDYNIDEVKKSKKFTCPCCWERCVCSRCFRYTKLAKAIACYITWNGNLDKWFNYLVDRNNIMNKLKDYLVLSQFMIFNFVPKNDHEYNFNLINNMKNSSESNLSKLKGYKKLFEEHQMYFVENFKLAKKQQILEQIHNQERNWEGNNLMLSKKRKVSNIVKNTKNVCSSEKDGETSLSSNECFKV